MYFSHPVRLGTKIEFIGSVAACLIEDSFFSDSDSLGGLQTALGRCSGRSRPFALTSPTDSSSRGSQLTVQETAALPHQAARLIIVVIFVLISRIPHVNVGFRSLHRSFMCMAGFTFIFSVHLLVLLIDRPPCLMLAYSSVSPVPTALSVHS